MKRKRNKPKKPKVAQWVRVITHGRGNYSVIFADAFGQVSAYDIHGAQLVTAFPPHEKRELRLVDIVQRRSCELLGKTA